MTIKKIFTNCSIKTPKSIHFIVHFFLLIVIILGFYFNSLLLQLSMQKINNVDENPGIIQIRSSSPSHLQEWNKTWGGSEIDYGHGLAIDYNNNTYIVGETWSFGAGYYDVFLVKYNSTGNQQWNLTWGYSNKSDYGNDITLDSNNSIYVVGRVNDIFTGDEDAFIAKFDSDGNQLWNKTWGGIDVDYSYGVAVDKNNNSYLAGSTDSFGAGSRDAFLVKFDSDGNQIWNHTWGGTNNDYGWAVAVDINNNIYLTGFTYSFGIVSGDAFLVKYDSAGNQSWNRTWGGSFFDDSRSIVVAGNITYSAGSTLNLVTGLDALVVKYDSDGNQLWNKTWGGPTGDYGNGIACDGENIYLAGRTDGFGAGSDDALIVKFNLFGDQLWNYTWGGSSQDWANAISVDASKNVYLIGQTNSFGAGSTDAFLVKYGIDSDYDGLTDSMEMNKYGTNPLDDDSDDDLIPDGWEVKNSLDPLNITDASDDIDNDGLSNLEEYNNSTDPNNQDTDNDGLEDGLEINVYYTDANNNDTDTDGLADGPEINFHGTNATNNDTDADWLMDGDEVNFYFTDPKDNDTDNDTYTDGEEIMAGTNPSDPNSYPGSPPDTPPIIGIEIYILITAISIPLIVTLFLIKRKFRHRKNKNYNLKN